MDFQFQAWEKLSDAVTDGPADTRVTIRGWHGYVRRCGEMLWTCRESDAAREHNFLVRARLSPQQTLNSERLRHFLCGPNRPGYLHRVWRLEPALFAVWSQERGWRLFENIGHCLDNDLEKSVGFQFHSVPRSPSSAVEAALRRTLHNTSSDLNLAARFLRLSALDRGLSLAQTRVGTPREFAALVQVALRASAAQWPHGIHQMELHFVARGRDAPFKLTEPPDLGIRERAILGHIIRHFEPRQNMDDPRLPAAVHAKAQGNWKSWFSVEVKRPSQHEQLEAALELRAWLQTHWPDGVRHLGKIV